MNPASHRRGSIEMLIGVTDAPDAFRKFSCPPGTIIRSLSRCGNSCTQRPVVRQRAGVCVSGWLTVRYNHRGPSHRFSGVEGRAGCSSMDHHHRRAYHVAAPTALPIAPTASQPRLRKRRPKHYGFLRQTRYERASVNMADVSVRESVSLRGHGGQCISSGVRCGTASPR